MVNKFPLVSQWVNVIRSVLDSILSEQLSWAFSDNLYVEKATEYEQGFLAMCISCC